MGRIRFFVASGNGLFPHSRSEARLQEPRLYDLLSDVGQRRLCWLRYLDELCITIRSVPEATSGEYDEQHRTGGEYHDILCLPASVEEGARPSCDDKMRRDEQSHKTGCIGATMRERREQHTSFCVIKDPRVEKRCGDRDDEETYIAGEDERSVH